MEIISLCAIAIIALVLIFLDKVKISNDQINRVDRWAKVRFFRFVKAKLGHAITATGIQLLFVVVAATTQLSQYGVQSFMTGTSLVVLAAVGVAALNAWASAKLIRAINDNVMSAT